MNLVIPSGPEIEPTGERYPLPQVVIDECRKISKATIKTVDPTTISHTKLPTNSVFKITKSPREQLFVSMISRPFFNVCQVIEDNGEYYSVGMDLSKIKGKLSIHEVVADVLLQGLLFYRYVDKCWIPSTDLKSPNNTSTHQVFNTQNFNSSDSNYYIYDIEGECLLEGFESKSDMLRTMLEEHLWLFGQDPEIIIEEFWERGLTEKEFGFRIVYQCMRLLEFYGFGEGREFFLIQAKKSGITGNLEILYENFISSLELISRTFEEDPEALNNYVKHDVERAKREVVALEARIQTLKDFLNR